MVSSHAMKALPTTRAVIDALGGHKPLQALTGRGRTAIVNWKAREKFPADTYLILQEALRTRRLTAPPSLWGMEPRQ